MKIQDTPMMADREVAIIDKLIDNIKPTFCLEWGSGGSTLYFPANHPLIHLWLSIEHNGNYVKYLDGKLTSNAHVIWVDKEWYLDCVKHQEARYSFILIDGEDREGCLRVAKDLLAPGGSILLHDAGRKEYQDFIKKSGLQWERLTEGETPVKEGGFAHRGLVRFWK